MNLTDTKNLRNWARFACEMKRLREIFPAHAGEIKQCVTAIAAKIKPAAQLAEIDAEAEGLRLCQIC